MRVMQNWKHTCHLGEFTLIQRDHQDVSRAKPMSMRAAPPGGVIVQEGGAVGFQGTGHHTVTQAREVDISLLNETK